MPCSVRSSRPTCGCERCAGAWDTGLQHHCFGGHWRGPVEEPCWPGMGRTCTCHHLLCSTKSWWPCCSACFRESPQVQGCEGECDVHTAIQGAVPMGEVGWERARVLAGRPAVDHEITDLYNPMEAGLCSAVSVTKVNSEQEVLICILEVLSQHIMDMDMGPSGCGCVSCCAGLLHRPGDAIKAFKLGCCEAAAVGPGPFCTCKCGR